MGTVCSSKKADTTVPKNLPPDGSDGKKKDPSTLTNEERKELERQKEEEIEKLKEGTNFIDYGVEDEFSPSPAGMRIVPLDFLSVVRREENALAKTEAEKVQTTSQEDVAEYMDSAAFRNGKSRDSPSNVLPLDDEEQVGNKGEV